MSDNFPEKVDPNSENIQENIKIMLLLFHLGRNKDKFIELKQSETSETLYTEYIQPIYEPIIKLLYNTKVDKQIMDDIQKGLYDNAVNSIPILSKLTKTINCITSKRMDC